jgi:teichuronic acid biosynthesis glycosyltransferase TuaC
VRVLPIGVDLRRFGPSERADARGRLGLPADGRLLLFPADPARPEKRADRARELAAAAGARLLTLGAVAAEAVPDWVNAADVVIVPSEREGFGLAVLEALACDVPVLATPVGVHPEALEGVEGALCAAWDLDRWLAAVQAAPERIAGRERASRWSADAMAERVLAAWRSLVHSQSG